MIGNRCLVVTIYVTALIILYADYNLLSPNLTQIANEFGMTEKERDASLGGQISLAFFVVGAPSSFLFGWLSDSIQHRVWILAIVILISEIACFATYFVKSFDMLFFTRTVTGVGIGGSLPVIFSILGDLFQAEGRNVASAIVSTATGLGLGIGQGLAGFLGPTYGWRLPFLIVSLPGFVLAGVCFFLNEPERGSKESAFLKAQYHGHQSKSDNEKTRVRDTEINPDECYNNTNIGKSEEKNDLSAESMDNPLNIDTLQTIIDDRDIDQYQIMRIGKQGIETQLFDKASQHSSLKSSISNQVESIDDTLEVYPVEEVSFQSTCKLLKTPTVILILVQGAPSVIPFGITSTFLNDYLAQEKGLTVEQATAVLLTFGAGNAVGVILGGYTGHFLYKRDSRLPPIAMGCCIILGCVPMWFIINMDYGGGIHILKASFIMFLTGVLLIVPVPIERAILSNVTLPEARGRANSFLSMVDNLGKALGPFLLSTMISTMGRPTAFNLSLIGWIIGGLVSCMIYFTVKKDEDDIQSVIEEKIVRGSATTQERI